MRWIIQNRESICLERSIDHLDHELSTRIDGLSEMRKVGAVHPIAVFGSMVKGERQSPPIYTAAVPGDDAFGEINHDYFYKNHGMIANKHD